MTSALSAFSLSKAEAHAPVSEGGEDFLQHLDYVGLMSGKASPFGVRLTAMQDGCIVGLSISHLLADAESVGQLLQDLARAYKGELLEARPASRLGMQLLALEAAGQASLAQPPSDEELVVSIPGFKSDACARQDWVDEDFHARYYCPPAVRQAGFYQEHHIFHIPAAGVERMRQEMLASSTLKAAGTTSLTVHDIIGALCWILREVGEGLDISSGLNLSLLYTVDLRRCGGMAGSGIPSGFWGNAVSGQIVMPPLHSSNPSSAANAVDCGVSGHLKDLFAAAAQAIHEGTASIRSNPDFRKQAMSLVTEFARPGAFEKFMTDPNPNPFKDNSTIMTSWRSGSMDRADFGHGTPLLSTGTTFPRNLKTSVVTNGPGGDGVSVSLAYRSAGLKRLQASKVLDVLAPELTFLQPASDFRAARQ